MQSDFLTHFEAYLLTQKRMARNTVLAYMQDLQQFACFLQQVGCPLDALSEQIIQEFLYTLKKGHALQARSMSRKISSLKVFFTYLHQQHGFADLTLNLQFPKLEKRLPNFLTEKEVEALLRCAREDTTLLGKRNTMVLLLLYSTGIRISEAMQLKISGIRFDTGFITVFGKGSKERLIPLAQPVLKELSSFLNEVHPKLLPKQTGAVDFLFPVLYKKEIKAMTRQAAWAIVKTMARKAGIERHLSPHTLRHSLATHLLEKGANLRLLQVWLGHENLSTVEIYTHINTNHLRKMYDKKHPRS